MAEAVKKDQYVFICSAIMVIGTENEKKLLNNTQSNSSLEYMK